MVPTSELIETIDILMKDMSDIDIVGLYQDKNHAIELSHKDGIFYVRLDGANLYAGKDGSKAASMFYDQIAQVHDDEDRGTDPDFAALREILQARNDHVKDMLAAIGHERLSASLDGIEMAKEFNMDSFQNIIKHNMTTLDVLNFAGYRPSEKENEECHTCVFFAAGGFCTKIDLPVKEEMVCDWFKSLPMPEKNEAWSHVSHQEWEEAEHEEEHDHAIEGVQKDVSKDLIYTSAEDKLESPANFNTSSRKPNVIMREFVPTDASEGFQIFAKNDVDEGIVEVQIVQRDGRWDVITKQRDYSDLGDPFQSVGEAHIPKKVKLLEDDDKEGVDKLREVRGQDGSFIEELQKSGDSSRVKEPAKAIEATAKLFNLTDKETDTAKISWGKLNDFSKWGMMNAITEVANTHDSYDRASELEIIGGKIIAMPTYEWDKIALAA